MVNNPPGLLGLEPAQEKVYFAALELGEATIQALARKSGVSRSTIYTFIESMRDRGFLHEMKRGARTVYGATDPEYVADRERERIARLEAMLPEFLAVHNASRKKPKVTYFEGFDGIQEVYTDMLKEKKEIVAYEDLEHLYKGLPKKIFDWFPQARAKRDILIKAISRDSSFAREFSKKNLGLLRETKFLAIPDMKTDINIYGNKIALIDLRGDQPFCVLIENKNLADTMRMIWRSLWSVLGEKN